MVHLLKWVVNSPTPNMVLLVLTHSQRSAVTFYTTMPTRTSQAHSQVLAEHGLVPHVEVLNPGLVLGSTGRDTEDGDATSARPHEAVSRGMKTITFVGTNHGKHQSRVY